MKTLTQQIAESQNAQVTINDMQDGKLTRSGKTTYQKATKILKGLQIKDKDLQIFRSKLNSGINVEIEHPSLEKGHTFTIVPHKGEQY